MHRLTGQDAFSLYRETPTAVMHRMKIFIMDPATQQVSMEQIRQGLKSYLHLVPVLRQRVVPVPFPLHHPVMINDPVKRYQAVRQQTAAGKQELAAFGKTTYGQLLE